MDITVNKIYGMIENLTALPGVDFYFASSIHFLIVGLEESTWLP